MKILLASDFFPPAPGGLEAHVQRLAKALLQHGHSVVVITSTPDPQPLPEGGLVISSSTVLRRAPFLFQDKDRAFPPPWPDPTFRGTVRKVVTSWKPDVIHAHGWCSFSCYWRDSPPLVVTLHDYGLRCPKKSLLRNEAECRDGLGVACLRCPGYQPMVKRVPLALALHHCAEDFVVNVDHFIAVSQSVARRAGELELVDSKLSVIPNFIDFSQNVENGKPREPTILFVGPDSPHKGRSVAIDAFQRLPEGTAQLNLVGSGTEVRVPGIRNLGYLTGADLAQQFEAASVLAVPSIWADPCPTVILEAMTYGLPVIGSRIGGIPDLVVEGETGLLVPANNPQALANSVLMMLNDEKMRDTMGSSAKKRVARFMPEAIVPKIEEIYSTVARTELAI